MNSLNPILEEIFSLSLEVVEAVPPLIIVLFDRDGLLLAIRVAKDPITDEYDSEILAENGFPDGQGEFREPVVITVCDQEIGSFRFMVQDGKVKGPFLN